MQPTFINGWWMSTDTRLGPYTILPAQPITTEQLYNAYKWKTYCESQGWSLSAICGMLGNAIHESTLNSAFIQGTNRYRLPNSAANITDVPNSTMINFYDSYYGQSGGGFAIGTLQWDGYTSTPPAGQKLVSYAERNNLIWYEGDTQISRLQAEYDNDLQFLHREVFGIMWTWQNYVVNTRTPEESADIWMNNYERAAAGLPEREGNARWFYDYFPSHPTPPSPPVQQLPPWMITLFGQERKDKRNVKRISYSC